MKALFSLGRWVVCFGLLLSMSACVKWAVVHQQASFDFSAINQIEVTPVVDGRRRITAKSKYDKAVKPIQQHIVKMLKKKKYEAVAASSFGSAGDLDGDQVVFADAQTIRKIGTGQSKWVLVPVVDDYFKVAGYLAAEISCYVFDRSTGRLVWEGSAMKTNLKAATTDMASQIPKKKS